MRDSTTHGAAMTHPVALIVYLHLLAAVAAFLLGAWQLSRPKGTPSHRAAGWIWAGLMMSVAVSSLWIPSFLQFSWIHLFTLLVLVMLPLGIWRARRGNVEGHRRAMRGLYAGGLVIAGIFTLVPGRLLGDLIWKGCWGC
jgi:uncharacterized membrane protein